MTQTPEPVDFLTVPLANGKTWTRLDRLTDGSVMCQLCFGYFPMVELNPIGNGMVEDVCVPCAKDEARAIEQPDEEGNAVSRRFFWSPAASLAYPWRPLCVWRATDVNSNRTVGIRLPRGMLHICLNVPLRQAPRDDCRMPT
jgi:hypothetical protein